VVDADGSWLKDFLTWRQQRQAAIQSELTRLQQQLQRMEAWRDLAAAQRAAGNSSHNASGIYGQLIAWMRQQGSLVGARSGRHISLAAPCAHALPGHTHYRLPKARLML